VNFKTDSTPKTREVFQCLAKKGIYWQMGKKKRQADIEYSFEHGEVINYIVLNTPLINQSLKAVIEN
jgi:hypothetical protein